MVAVAAPVAVGANTKSITHEVPAFTVAPFTHVELEATSGVNTALPVEMFRLCTSKVERLFRITRCGRLVVPMICPPNARLLSGQCDGTRYAGAA